jgi:hypothetical protein
VDDQPPERCRRCGSRLFWNKNWVVCIEAHRDCPPLCPSCGQEMRFDYSLDRAHRVLRRSCACPVTPPPEYPATAGEIARAKRWFSDHWEPVGDDFARWVLDSVAEVAAGKASAAEFRGRTGAVAVVTPEDARSILDSRPAS